VAEHFSGSIFGHNFPSNWARSLLKVSMASVQLPEHFKPPSISPTLISGCLD